MIGNPGVMQYLGRVYRSGDFTRDKPGVYKIKTRRIQEVMMRVGGRSLRRSRSNRVIAGVCGGLEEFFGLDAFWFRLGFLIALLPGGVPGIVIYVIMWLIVPSE